MGYNDAVMGEFLQRKPSLNLNTALNYLLTKDSRLIPSALITQVVSFPDVSFYQEEIDFSIMCERTDAIILRAGQNMWKDDQFERNYAEARACGKKIGVYWFYDGRASPSDQGKVLVSALLGKTLELGVYIDWERNYGGAHEGLRPVVALMEMVENAGLDIKEVGLYTGYYFFRGNSNPITNASQYEYLKRHPLWLAWYTNIPTDVRIPAPWTDLLIWQYGTPVMDFGQKTLEIDMNWFNGTQKEFEERYGEIVEEPMADYMELKSNTSVGRSIREQTNYPQTPHIFGSKKDTLLAGEVAKSLPEDRYVYTSDVIVSGAVQARAGDIWWKIYELRGQPIDGWVAEKHLGQVLLTITPKVNPNPSPSHVIEVVLDGEVIFRKELL